MPIDKVKQMFEIQKNFTGKFFKERFNLDIDNMTEEQRIFWSKEFILSGSKEMYEMLDEINWKKHRFTGQQNNIDNFIEEGVDTMKFLINLFVINGCSSDQFYEKFIDKSAVVDIRYKQETELQFIKNSTDKFVVFDIDGVLNKYPNNFMVYAAKNEFYYKSLADFRMQNPSAYKILKKQFRETGQERKAEAVEIASILLKEVRSIGYKVILLTARPYKHFTRLFADTTNWLKDHDLVYDFIFFDERKEDLLIDTFRKDQIMFIVDDDIDNVNKLKTHFDNVILIQNKGLFTDQDFTFVKPNITIIPNLKTLYETYTNILSIPTSTS